MLGVQVAGAAPAAGRLNGHAHGALPAGRIALALALALGLAATACAQAPAPAPTAFPESPFLQYSDACSATGAWDWASCHLCAFEPDRPAPLRLVLKPGRALSALPASHPTPPAGSVITCSGALSEYDVFDVLDAALDMAQDGAVTVVLR